MENSCSYLIYKSGNNIFAQNSLTGKIDYSGTNDAAAIQNAINALTSGGKIFIKDGTYSGTIQVTSKANVYIVGEEAEKVIFSGIGINIYNTDHVTVENISFTGNPSFACTMIQKSNHVKVINCRADNIGTARTSVFMIYVDANTTLTDILFQDCIVTNGGRAGYMILSEGNANAKLTDTSFVRCQAIACGKTSQYNDYVIGFNINESVAGGIIEDNIKVIDCIARECWESGFHMESVGTCNNIFFVRCISESNGQKPIPEYGHGFILHGNVNVIDCMAKNNLGSADGTGCGVYVSTGNDILIEGCTMDSNHKQGILLAGTIARGIIISNKINGGNVGIQSNSLASDLIITDNNILSPSNVGISCNGDNCIINNNRVINSTGYSINIPAMASRCIINDNHLTGAGQQNIYINGAANQNLQITNNIVLDSAFQSIYLDANTVNTYVAMNYVNKTIYNGGKGNIIKNNMGYVTETNVLSGTFAIDSIGIKTVTIVHGLNITPTVQDCHLTVVQNTAVDDWAYDLLKVVSTDITNVTVKINISKASTSIGATAKFSLRTGNV